MYNGIGILFYKSVIKKETWKLIIKITIKLLKMNNNQNS